MRIAVIGSWRDSDRTEWRLKDRDGFRAAAAALGRKIIELGHSLIVGSDNEITADFHAAQAAALAVGKNPTEPRIHIMAPRGHAAAFVESDQEFPGVFTQWYVEADNWAPVKVFQVKEADRVLILGGATESRQAGLTAVTSEKRVVCIGSFGGAAMQMNDYLTVSRHSWGNSIPTVEELGILQRPWSELLCSRVPKLLRFDNKPKILIIHGRSKDRLTLEKHLQESLKLPTPTIMAERLSPGEVLPIKFEQLASEVDGAIALGTPDDLGYLADAAGAGKGEERRARQNVWLEVGWFWGRLGRARVLILTRGEISIPSDLFGIESYAYSREPTERSEEIDTFVHKLSRGIAET
jgi:Predicted nucleotide-binding protein containing TIR-like domain